MATARALFVDALTTAAAVEQFPPLMIGLLNVACLWGKEAACAADLSVQQERRRDALVLLDFIETHPASWHPFRLRSHGQRQAIEATMAATDGAGAYATGGGTRLLDEVVTFTLARL